MIDGIVSGLGEQALLVNVATAAFDDYDSFDPATATFTVQVIRAVFSSPSSKESRNLAGRGIDATEKATVPSTYTVQADREGRADHIVRIPGATSISVASAEGVWTVTIDETDYTSSFSAGGVVLGSLARSAYRDLLVKDARKDKHPFTGVTKQTVYLQEMANR